jgi:hypothetical protein
MVQVVGENPGSFPGAARREHLVAIPQELGAQRCEMGAARRE